MVVIVRVEVLGPKELGPLVPVQLTEAGENDIVTPVGVPPDQVRLRFAIELLLLVFFVTVTK